MLEVNEFTDLEAKEFESKYLGLNLGQS